MYRIRKAAPDDLPRILEIYACARDFMERTGNPNQWKKTNPPRQTLEADIPAGRLYVVEENGIHGVFAYFTEPDPTYAYIENGAWLDESPYGTLHRVAGDGNGGIFQAVLSFALNQNPHIRIDTHEDNKVMQHILQKHGFQSCGTIYLANGEPRIAFEKA